MAAQTTYPVYDPWAKENPPAEHLSELRQYNQHCFALVKKVYERNKAAGKKGKELFWALGILRARPDKVWVNFNLAMPLAKYEIFPRDEGAVDYGGAMGAAETLLNGEYRIANIEEEAECRRKDIEAHNAVMARRAQAGTANIAAMIGTMAKQVMGPVTPSPAGTKGR